MLNRKKQLQSYFHFCPRCGTQLGWITKNKEKELWCKKCHYTFWMNSKPCASIILVKGTKVLLIKRNIDPHNGYWDVPGGFLDVQELFEDGARRELLEELGVRVKKLEPIGVYTDWYESSPPQSNVALYYYSRSWTGKLKAQDDADSFRWFSIRSLPKRIAFLSGKKALRELHKLLIA